MKNIHYSLWLLPLLFLLSKGEPAPTMPKNYALFFAAKDYQEWSSLRNPIRDAEAVAKKLESEFGFTTEIVRNPTKRQIQLELNDYLTRDFEEEDQLLIFFTGHGEFNTLTNQGYFIPVDGKKDAPFHDSHLSLNTLKPTISSIPCEHILLTIDACYSGSIDEELAMGDWKSSGDNNRTWKRPGVNANNAKQQWISKELKKRSRLFLTSGGVERTNDGVNHSPFTERLMAVLSGPGLEDGVLTFNELEGTMTNGKLQPQPRTGYFNRHQRDGNFLFVREFTTPLATPSEAVSKETDLQAYSKAKQEDSVEAFEAYLAAFPQGDFRNEANSRLYELKDDIEWQYAKLKNNRHAFQDYLNEYPNGKHSKEAQKLLEERKKNLFTIVEDPPVLPACTGAGDRNARQKCTNNEFKAFVDANLQYPEGAIAKGIKGIVVVEFVIETDGTISNPAVTRHLEDNCDAEALRVIWEFKNQMKTFIPAKQRGRPVRYKFSYPFRFTR